MRFKSAGSGRGVDEQPATMRIVQDLGFTEAIGYHVIGWVCLVRNLGVLSVSDVTHQQMTLSADSATGAREDQKKKAPMYEP